MRRDLAEILCCPVTKKPLQLTVDEEDEHGNIMRGRLYSKGIDFTYPIEEGIPNLLPPEYHVDGVKPGRAGATKGKAGKKR